jgi:hypothetical protein
VKIQLSNHALRQIVARKLDPEVVRRAAGSPDQIVEQEGELPTAQTRIVFRGKPALLRIAFRDDDEVRLVITAYATTKIEKYWR